MSVEAYWQAYAARLPRPTPYTAWAFGDRAEMADHLGALVLEGRKQATCSLLWVYEADPALVMPAAGQHSVVLDGRDEPICIIETTAVVVCPFAEVDAAFAAAEGEGDGSLAYWRRVHWAFFGRECAKLGRTAAETMPLVCERFRRVYP
jgi:uncharacterized protein YhfF